MKTDQRENTEYEFDCVVRLDPDEHTAHVEKVRGCTAMDGATGDHPGPEFWRPLMTWWHSAEAVPVPPPPPPPTPSPAEVAAVKLLDGATTLEQLASAWKTLPIPIQEKLESHKNARKAALSAPPKPAPSPTSKVGADGIERDERGNPIQFTGGATPDPDQTDLFENSNQGPVD